LPVLGTQTGVFYLLVAMSMVPQVASQHQRRGIPAEVTRDTLKEIAAFSANYRGMTDGWLGIPIRQLYWLRHYTAERLYRIGRFEYMLAPFKPYVEVYRRRTDRYTLALATDGLKFNTVGYAPKAGEAVAWVASLQRTEDSVTGCPISPRGYAIQQPVTLSLAEWELVVKPGDQVLDMHIPAGGSMQPEACADSFRRVVPFFRRYFPEEKFAAISCRSWIFGTQLQEIRLSSDNLARLQREVYLYPTTSNPQGGLWFIFLRDDLNMATVPRRTSLQRAVAEYIEAGKTWRGGGMLLLTDDVDRYGTQMYWNQPSL